MEYYRNVNKIQSLFSLQTLIIFYCTDSIKKFFFQVIIYIVFTRQDRQSCKANAFFELNKLLRNKKNVDGHFQVVSDGNYKSCIHIKMIAKI